MKGAGWTARVRAWLGLGDLDREVDARLEAEHDAHVQRLLRDPFRFASWDDYRRFRRRHGRRAPRRRPEAD